MNDCALNLMGESQEEDRRQIAEMVLKVALRMALMALMALMILMILMALMILRIFMIYMVLILIVLKEMETRCLPAHTNGHIGDSETSSAAESASKEKKERKNLPGPVQRGPGNRVSSHQGRIKPLFAHSL